jgi:opacity protein-like surface antigen
MKKVVLSGAICIYLIGCAAAAGDDAAPKVSWTGCYLGGHIGGAWGQGRWLNPAQFPLTNGANLFADGSLPFEQQIAGGLAGLQAGCRYQVSSDWVMGLGGDWSDARIVRDDSLTPFVSPPGVGVATMLKTNSDWLATATGSIGYAFDRLLVYGKGGVAWAQNRYEVVASPAVFAGSDFKTSETRTGWVAGVGIEYALTSDLSTTIEYDYYDFGQETLAFVDQAGTTGSAKRAQRVNAIKFGLNYRFADFGTAAGSPKERGALLSFGSTGWTQTFQTETRFFSWKSMRGFPTNSLIGTVGHPTPNTAAGSGSEIYIPYALQLTGQPGDVKFEILGRGGFVRARQSTSGLTGQVSTVTDTVGSVTATYMGWQGIQPFASVELNLPTGRSSLAPTEAPARMDPDLVDIATFGEGFNIGPTVGFNLPVTETFILSTSAGYTHRGSFRQESTLTPTAPGGDPVVPAEIHPGSVFTLTGSAAFQLGAFTGKVTAAVSQETTTTENDTPFIRPGRRYVVSANGGYSWPTEHVGTTTLSGSLAHSRPNDVLFVYTGAPTTLMPEPENTNSNVYQIGLEHLFLPTDQFAIGPKFGFLYRDHNSYDPASLQFVPAKRRWSAGLSAKYAVNNVVTLNARAERVWTREYENPAPGDNKYSLLSQSNGTAFSIPVVSSTGWQFVFGATASF